MPIDQEIWHEAMEILIAQMGPAKAMRALSVFQMGHGDYMRERDEMFGQMSVAEISKEVRRYERRKPKP